MNELLHLAPNVWPRNTTRDEVGVVCIAGIPLTQLAQEYGTPLFVIDEDDFRSRCRETVAEHDVEQAADQHADGPGLPGRCKHSGSVAHVVYAQLFMTSYGSYPR